LFDLMIAFAGMPRWVAGHVTVGGRDATAADAREGSEPVGPIAGDSISAQFGFDGGVRGAFDSTVNLDRPGHSLYGLWIECQRATLHVRGYGDVYVYPSAQVQPKNAKLAWEKTWIEDWHFTPEHLPRSPADWIHRGNVALVRDLIAAAREDREPLASGAAAHAVIELIQGVYASHLSGGRRLPIPLTERRHPLAAAGKR
jgi:predicted dehydrogenase